MSDTIVVTDATTRAEIEALIADCRKRAVRYSINDRRRLRLDEQVDCLVEDWIAAGS